MEISPTSVTTDNLRPKLKTGVRLWRSRLSGEWRVGTRRRNIALPEVFNGLATDFVINSLNGKRTLNEIASIANSTTGDKELELPGELLRVFVAILRKANLIDLEGSASETDRVSAKLKRLSMPVDGESIDSISLREKQLQIEQDSITFRDGIIDGGIGAILKRKEFKILIFNTNRLAITLAGALKSAGFEQIAVIDRSPKGHRSRTVQGEDLIGCYLRNEEILHLKAPLIDELLQSSNSSFAKIANPDLIITLGSPAFEAQQRWQSEGTAHLIIDFENSAEVRIGPLVLPGRTPCLSCIEASELENGLGLPERNFTKKTELATGLVLMATGLAALLVGEFADTGGSPLLGRTLDLSSYQTTTRLMNGQALEVREWQSHPLCGCSN
jgi:hypothetical protein